MKKFLLIFLLFAGNISASEEASFTAEPEWIIQPSIPDSNEIPYSRVKYGTHYLHFGRQVRVPSDDNPAYYFRYVTKIINQTGLDDQSQINIEFYPIYERVFLHKLNIRRDGETLDKLGSARISYLDQETELDQQLYNGTKTINLLLDDLRVGDVLDYSYTIEGRNPVFQNLFNGSFVMQWGIPVSSVYLRMLWQKDARLTGKVLNSDWEISKHNTAAGEEYIIHRLDVEPAELEDDTPSWVDPYATVLFSEQSSWEEVVDWGRGLFSTVVDDGANVRAIAAKISRDHPDRTERIARTLQFVQEEIRYVGIELGENSHQAVSAETTLQRRYGDCKDKTTLMISLLNSMGIDAYPALVNTGEMGQLAQRIPSMNAFNHVIVAVPHEQKTLWLDPTRQYQVGNLEHIFQPDYGLALLLKKGSRELTPMNATVVASGYDISEHYDFSADNVDLIDLSVDTQYYGYSAENQIARLQRVGMEQIKADYLEFYRNYYPSIDQLEVSDFAVDEDNFRFKIKEQYQIRDFWEMQEDNQRKVGWVYSNAVDSLLEEPDKISRTQDYKLAFPWNTNQTIKISLPDRNWDFVDSEFTEENDFFEFRRSQEYDPNSKTVYLGFSYASKSNHVPAAEFPSYLAALARSREQLDFGFYLDGSRQGPQDYTAILVTAFICYIGLIFLALLLWYRSEHRDRFTGKMQYYPVDSAKFLYMWIMSWGLFPIYWFYKNWNFERAGENGSRIMPTMRGLFYQFWYYPLFKCLSGNSKLKESEQRLPGKFEAIALAIIFFVSLILSSTLETFALPLLALSAILALPLLKMINIINRDNEAAIKHNSTWSLRHYLLGAIFLPLFVFNIGPALGLLPADSVVPGDRLLGHDIKFMQRAGIISPGDRIEYFYSDAFFTIRHDGNGFTDRHVFSYWLDENDSFNVETVEFDDIDDIKVFWSAGFGENTVVEVFRKDQTKLILFLSGNDNKDKLFIRELRANWTQYKKNS